MGRSDQTWTKNVMGRTIRRPPNKQSPNGNELRYNRAGIKPAIKNEKTFQMDTLQIVIFPLFLKTLPLKSHVPLFFHMDTALTISAFFPTTQ